MANEALEKFKTEVEEAANYQFDTVVFTTWLRMAESRISDELRCEDQIEFATAVLSSGRARLPRGWQELEFVRVVDGPVLHVTTREAIYDEANRDRNRYSVTGNFILVGPPINQQTGLSIEATYFAKVPELGDTETWMSEDYRWLIFAAVMGYAAIHLEENDRAAMMAAEVAAGIARINEAYQIKKFSGSLIRSAATPRKGF